MQSAAYKSVTLDSTPANRPWLRRGQRKTRQRAALTPLLLSLLFFVSGFPALLYQIVWQRTLFTIYGVNIESVTIVVTAFMLGLGLGSLAGGWVSKRPGVPVLKLFAAIELLIALFGVLSLPFFHWVASFTAQVPAGALGFVAFLLVVFPTMLMGATLPLLTSHLVRLSGNVGRSVGILYFVNTLGSAAACFMAAKLSMPLFGMSGSVHLAAAMNVLVGLAVLIFAGRLQAASNGYSTVKQDRTNTATTSSQDRLPFWGAMILSALCGFVALSYELAWYRIFSFASGGEAKTFPYLLGFYLLGIALGSLAVRYLCGQRRGIGNNLVMLWLLVTLANVAAFLVGPLLVQSLPFMSPNWAMAFIAVPAALLGATFPLICHCSIPPDGHSGSRVSLLYVSNIVGSTAGTFVTGFILMDFWPLPTIALVLSLVGLAVGLLVLPAAGLTRARTTLLAGATVSSVLTLWVVGPSLFDRFYERLQPHKYGFTGTDRFAEVVETKSGVITVTHDKAIFGGGIHDGYFNIDLMTDMNRIYRAYALSALHPAPRRVLMIGLASGSWAQVMANHPQLDRMTVVEINPGYLETISRHADVAGVLRNPKVAITIDDGRRWMVRHPDEKFDVIVMNTIFNWRANASNMLSLDFLQIVREHLNPGGIALYNTTGSGEVALTGVTAFRHAVGFGSLLAVSDSPLVFDRDRWRQSLIDYRIDGRPALDLSVPEQRQRLDGLVGMAGVEAADDIRQRFRDHLIITDDNMGVEWR